MMEKKRYEQPQTTVTNIEPSGVLCGSNKLHEYNSLNRNFAVFFFEFDGVDDGGML